MILKSLLIINKDLAGFCHIVEPVRIRGNIFKSGDQNLIVRFESLDMVGQIRDHIIELIGRSSLQGLFCILIDIPGLAGGVIEKKG